MISIKRFVAALMAVLILSFAVPFTGAFAAEESFVLEISADRESVSCGNTVTFTILAKDINVEGGLLSLDVPFRFDTSVFEFIGKAPIYPSEWTAPADFSYSTPKNGLLWLRSLEDSNAFTENGCSRDGALGFRVTLKAKTNAAIGNSTVTINGDGVFEVISGTAADGMCSEVGGTGSSITVAVTAFDILLGDLNGDGKVNNLDASFALKYDAGITDLTAEQKARGDINGDGRVNNLDATVILKIDAGVA